MSYEVRVPKWGLTTESVTVVSWHVGEGDAVTAGDSLCEVETDKANSQIQSPVTGLVGKLLVDVGDDCDVGQPIAVIT